MLVFRSGAWPCGGLALTLALLAAVPKGMAQGCVAVRGAGQCAVTGGMAHDHDDHDAGYLQSGDWQASVSYRWLHSDRHFVGDREFELPRQLGAEAINDSHFIDLSALYAITPRFSAGLTLPLVYSTRSTLYEHDRANRHTTAAGGVGDLRLAAYAWLLDPKSKPRGNVSLGLGPKFPTGDSAAEDTFHSARGPVVRPVDQSIQPGDGGFGFMVEALAFYQLAPRWTGYAQGSYLFNPQNVNGVSTETGLRLGNPFEQEMSIPDQYFARAGLDYSLVARWGLSVSLGGRIDGVPVRDALGGTDGFRRPGFAVSIEPGLTWTHQKWALTVTVPVAVYRNRQRSVADERMAEITGVARQGDAAFADLFVTASVSRRF